MYNLAFEKKIVLEYLLCVRALDFLENRALHEKISFFSFSIFTCRRITSFPVVPRFPKHPVYRIYFFGCIYYRIILLLLSLLCYYCCCY